MNILVVDDLKVIQITVSRLLQKMGYYNVKQAYLVNEAMNILNDNDIDLIISDWHMMGESGLDLLKKVHSNENTAGIPFVMLTADAEKERVVEAAKEGIEGYLIKPVSFPKLFDIIKEIARKYDLQMPIGLNAMNEGNEKQSLDKKEGDSTEA